MTQHANIAAAFVAAQSQMTHVVKSKEGQARGARYKYADLADVIEMLRPILKANGLAFQSVNDAQPSAAVVRTRLIHESGETMESDGTLVPAGDIRAKDGTITPAGGQQYGIAYTYARRYDLMALMGIAGDDTDGQTEMKQHAARVTAETAPKLNDQQQAIITSIMLRAGSAPKPGAYADKLAEDYTVHHLPAAIQYAVKEGVIDPGTAEDVLAAGKQLDHDAVKELIGASS